MKTFWPPIIPLCLTSAICVLSSASISLAQGTILFDTLEVGARVYDEQCEPLTGEEFVAQLYVAHAGSFQFQPVGAPVVFGEGDAAGYVQGGNVVIPFAPPFTFVDVQMFVWESRFASYEEARQVLDGWVGQTGSYGLELGSADYPATLYGMETLWGGCPSQVDMKIARGDSSIELTWSIQGFPSFYVVVPQEAETPLGPWRDIDGPWNPEIGRTNPPNPFQLNIPSTTRFYRMRLTTNIGP